MALPNPVCNMDLMKLNNRHLKCVFRLVALQDGGALVYNRARGQHQVVRVDREGQTVPPVYTCKRNSDIRGIITYHGLVFVLQDNGTITKHKINDISKTLATYKVEVGSLCDGTVIYRNQLLLPDYKRNEVFVYNTDDRSKQVVITKAVGPASVACNHDRSVIAVCEGNSHCVSLYNRSYIKQATIGSKGKTDGCLNGPHCVIFSPTGSLLVADFYNKRVCEYSQQGEFIKNVMTSDHGPLSLSYSHPHLWVACEHGNTVNRFKYM